jgi:hypothetical protein
VEWILRPVRTSGCLLHEDKKKGEKERYFRIKYWNIRPRLCGRITLKCLLEKWDGMAWTEFVWFRIGISGMPL